MSIKVLADSVVTVAGVQCFGSTVLIISFLCCQTHPGCLSVCLSVCLYVCLFFVHYVAWHIISELMLQSLTCNPIDLLANDINAESWNVWCCSVTAKIRNLKDYHSRTVNGILPAASGADIANTLKYFSQTLLGYVYVSVVVLLLLLHVNLSLCGLFTLLINIQDHFFQKYCHFNGLDCEQTWLMVCCWQSVQLCVC